MKVYESREKREINHIRNQLHELGFKDTAGMTRRELVHKLAVKRAAEVKVESPGQGWF
ncbi:hypothetical protein ACFSMW_13375 [Virgibacillus halophilus]|uniref:Fur-regulated basic protein A n=1 Tax=Tigheibacillus halophilus TaxID=361280 RepID=A0ABU5C970_9BACI|nr:hypothetical protein [Virgibacillus halophilus]